MSCLEHARHMLPGVVSEPLGESGATGAVSLGQPLANTVVELRNSDGVVCSGNGHIWIGM